LLFITDGQSFNFNSFFLKLSRPVVFSDTAQAIRYDEIDELATPWVAAIVGWGATFVRKNLSTY
jgi:hypothetical protein